jgi:SAM-dependent methyltransferase
MSQLPPNLFDLGTAICENDPPSVLDIGAGDGKFLDFLRGRYEKGLYFALETDLENISKIQSRSIPFAIEGIENIGNYRNFEYAICHGDLSDDDLDNIKKCAKIVYWEMPYNTKYDGSNKELYPFGGIKKIKG